MPEFHDPSRGRGEVVKVDVVGSFEGPASWWAFSWLGVQVGYILEIRWLNLYATDAAPAHDRTWTITEPTGARRPSPELGEEVEECEVVDRTYIRKGFTIAQKYEFWRINLTLAKYYEFIGGWDLGEAIAGASLASGMAFWTGRGLSAVAARAATIGNPTAPFTVAAGAASTAGTALGLVGFGGTVFYLVTAQMVDDLPPGRKTGENWHILYISFSPQALASESAPYWVPCDEIEDH